MGQWQLVVIILSLYETNDWIPSCPLTVGVHNTTKTITSPVKVFTVLTWRTCIPRVARQVVLLGYIALLTLLRHGSDYRFSSSRL
jgi:hypothetical protein